VSTGAQRQVAEVKPTPQVIHLLSFFRSIATSDAGKAE